ncbi:MAG: hypothetical protein ACHBN1_25255 [Heteroscytonema crispum UTEX LB 1556]
MGLGGKGGGGEGGRGRQGATGVGRRVWGNHVKYVALQMLLTRVLARL